MKIGIITYHWAANYGAVLQAFALQTFLIEQGHQVEIINYYPYTFKHGISFFIKHPSAFIHIRSFLNEFKKNRALDEFRKKELFLTKEYNSYEELQKNRFDYDIIISGSDQILNPSFTLFGENIPTSSYYLTFDNVARKIGYAVSFGCTDYPEPAKQYAKQWINSFERIGVRESSGLRILQSLEFKGANEVVPDPLILAGAKRIGHLLKRTDNPRQYRCAYLLRYTKLSTSKNMVIIDETTPYSMEEWVTLIVNAKEFVTNSFHGMLIAILFHVPFAVRLESGEYKGMNDRFYSTLEFLGLVDRIVSSNIENVFEKEINWEEVDDKLSDFSTLGANFIGSIR